MNPYLMGSLLFATFESWSLTFSIPWALDFARERWRRYVQNSIQHTRLRVWLVGLVGMIGMYGMESRDGFGRLQAC